MSIRTTATAAFAVGFLAFSQTTSARYDVPCGEYSGTFRISDTKVVPGSRYIARFRVLGAEITSSGEYDIPVTCRIKVGDTEFEPFGAISEPAAGNVNDHKFPKDFIMPDERSGETPLTIEARSWTKASGYTDGTHNSDWKSLITVTSTQSSDNLLVLRNGDQVPAIAPFMNQSDISAIVKDYINTDTGRVMIAEDEAIYLFELGTTNLSSAAADFQDFVILVTLADDKCHFEGPSIPPGKMFD